MATIPTSIEVTLNSEQLQELLSKIDTLEKRVAELENYFKPQIITIPQSFFTCEGCE